MSKESKLTLEEAGKTVSSLHARDPKVRALSTILAEAICDQVLAEKPVEAHVLAEAAVRAAAIVCSVCALKGNEATMMRLGGMIWLRIADEIDAQNGYNAAFSPMPATMQ